METQLMHAVINRALNKNYYKLPNTKEFNNCKKKLFELIDEYLNNSNSFYVKFCCEEKYHFVNIFTYMFNRYPVAYSNVVLFYSCLEYYIRNVFYSSDVDGMESNETIEDIICVVDDFMNKFSDKIEKAKKNRDELLKNNHLIDTIFIQCLFISIYYLYVTFHMQDVLIMLLHKISSL